LEFFLLLLLLEYIKIVITKSKASLPQQKQGKQSRISYLLVIPPKGGKKIYFDKFILKYFQ